MCIFYPKKSLVLFFICYAAAYANAQSIVKGKVIDDISFAPIEGAVVLDSIAHQNVITDKDGIFLIKNMKEKCITISCSGYFKQNILLKNEQNILVHLKRKDFDLKEIIIFNHQNNINTSKLLSTLDLNMQPAKSAQDFLRLVPGLFIAQHQGGGKAEQIFLRGFSADHGTDVNISVDGMPVNMVSHVHGQGYADLHFMIPETVAGYDFGKGPYYTNKGDFCTAGYVAYNTLNSLPNNMLKIEDGKFKAKRISTTLNLFNRNESSAYIAAEALYSNGGLFVLPENFTRYNLFGKINTKIGINTKFTLTVSQLNSHWKSSGEIPNRSIQEKYIADEWGVLDTAQGGQTSRTNVNIKFTTKLPKDFIWENQTYYSHYRFNLITNYSFFCYYPTLGDEFRQHEKRELYFFKNFSLKTKFKIHT